MVVAMCPLNDEKAENKEVLYILILKSKCEVATLSDS